MFRVTETNGHPDDRPLDQGPLDQGRDGALDASAARRADTAGPCAEGEPKAPISPDAAEGAAAASAAADADSAPAGLPAGEEVVLEFESPADASLAAEEAALEDLPDAAQDDALPWHDEDAEASDPAAASAEHAAELVAHAPRLEPIEAPEAPLAHPATGGVPTALASGATAVATAGVAGVRATGSWLDDKWGRLNATPEARRRMECILFGLVMLLAALVRFVNLDKPGILVFDETFYVKDSWTLVQLGYEGKWPDGANDAWAAGNPNTYIAEGSYVVHPPLGKLVIGLGMLILGADNPWGWRITVAVLGTLLVGMVWFIGKRLFRSPVLATLAAGLVAIDGHAIVTSRITILDGVLTFFVVLGFWLFLIDRDDQRRKLAAKIARWREANGLEGDPEPTAPSLTASAPAKQPSGPDWGPALWNRPWFMAAAVAFACASAVKWSGLYFLAAFCVYSLVVDMLERRRQGVTLWASAALLKQGPVSFLLAIPLALVTYLATWIPWFSTSNGFYRHWAEEPGHAWTGALSWVPLPVQSLWHYQAEAYHFHTTLQASHPYQSAPWQWPFLIRPTAFSYIYHTAGDGSGCGVEQCVNAITSLSNPLIWWLGTAAILVLIVLQIARPTWRGGAILVGYAAGYAPWLAVFDRQAVFHFYAIVMLPFMALAIAEVVRQLIGTNQDPRPQRSAATWTLVGVVGLIAIVSAAFYPIWAGYMIPSGYWNLLVWLPGWR
ncbi:putative dolichyl-phosphate-mannose--protein mannosyltransferase [Pseudoclavibacter triregionum]|nr:putative dolichyl-phosphate-mannose--protein mannosyltransferase [Pseudoclavibacter triregionum]